VGPAGAAEEEDEELEVDEPGVQRDQDGLAIIEKLRPGPRDFGKDPEGEGVWAFVEPNSGIRLSCVSPSQLSFFPSVCWRMGAD
jgi:hypothetical protein